MKKILIIGFLLLSVRSEAQQSLNTQNISGSLRKDFDGEKITVVGTAIGFTSSKINPTVTDAPTSITRATLATCTNDSSAGAIRVSTVSTPTSAIGLEIAAGQSFKVYLYDNIAAFLAIRTTGTSGILNCIYSRVP